MNQLTIFTVYVLMQSQSDCDEAKRICEEYGLPMLKGKRAFEYSVLYTKFCYGFDSFFIGYVTLGKTEASLNRFKELCEEWKQLNK